MSIILDSQEKIVFQKKSAPNLGIYFAFNSIVHLFAILGFCAIFIIFRFIDAGINPIGLLSTIHEILLSDTVFDLNSLSFQGKLFFYTFILVMITGFLTLLIPLFFSLKNLKKRQIFFTNTRCFINASDSSAQIDYDSVECVTLYHTWIEKYLNMATISIVDKKALSTDDIYRGTINSLCLFGLNMQDARDILEFFKTKNIKTAIKSEILLDATMSESFVELQERLNRKK